LVGWVEALEDFGGGFGLEDAGDVAALPGGFGGFGGDGACVEVVSDGFEAVAGGAQGLHEEDGLDLGVVVDEVVLLLAGFGGGAGDGQAGFAVGDGAGAEVFAAHVFHGVGGAFANGFAFPLGHGAEDGEDEFALDAGGGEVFAAAIGDVEGDAEVVELFVGVEEKGGGAVEAIEFGDDEVGDGVADGSLVLDEVEELASARALVEWFFGGFGVLKCELGGEGEVFVGDVALGALELGFEGVFLFVGGDAGVEGGGGGRGFHIADFRLQIVIGGRCR
jgi:hypothetical protein